MHFEDMQIYYQGFQPSESAKAFVESVMQEIYEESPYGSSLRVTFSRSGGLFKGMVHVNSYAGPFFAVATDIDLKQTARKLLDRTRRRLDKWKAKRFDRHGIKQVLRDLKSNPIKYLGAG